MLFRVFKFHLVLLLFDFAQNGTFPDLDSRLFEIGLGLLQIGCALFGVALVLGLLLFDLMTEIIILSLRFAGEFQLVGIVELGQQVSGVHGHAILDQFDESQITALTFGDGHAQFDRTHGLNGSSHSDDAGRIRRKQPE